MTGRNIIIGILVLAALGLVVYFVQKDEANGDLGGNGEPVACTMEAMLCPDGSYVGRDPQNNCEFRACPGDSSAEEEEVIFDKG